MSRFLQILFTGIVIAVVIGFVIKTNDPVLGDRIIGVSILFSAFIFMPLFIYHRWKDKRLADYTLTNENFEKMKSTGKKQNQSKENSSP